MLTLQKKISQKINLLGSADASEKVESKINLLGSVNASEKVESKNISIIPLKFKAKSIIL